jgi:hypothetical protein
MPEHWRVVLEASEKRTFYAIDGDSPHVLSPFVEPCIDERSSCGIAFAEQGRHRRIGERLGVGSGKGQY